MWSFAQECFVVVFFADLDHVVAQEQHRWKSPMISPVASDNRLVLVWSDLSGTIDMMDHYVLLQRPELIFFWWTPVYSCEGVFPTEHSSSWRSTGFHYLQNKYPNVPCYSNSDLSASSLVGPAPSLYLSLGAAFQVWIKTFHFWWNS